MTANGIVTEVVNHSDQNSQIKICSFYFQLIVDHSLVKGFYLHV